MRILWGCISPVSESTTLSPSVTTDAPPFARSSQNAAVARVIYCGGMIAGPPVGEAMMRLRSVTFPRRMELNRWGYFSVTMSRFFLPFLVHFRLVFTA